MIQPMNSYVLVKQVDPPKEMRGILVPASVQQKYVEGKGEVIAIGRNAGKGGALAIAEPLDLHVGDIVLYNKWDANDVKDEGAVYHLIEYGKLLGRMKVNDTEPPEAS